MPMVRKYGDRTPWQSLRAEPVKLLVRLPKPLALLLAMLVFMGAAGQAGSGSDPGEEAAEETGGPAGEAIPLVAAVHVHSDVTDTGTLSPAEIAALASEAGLDVVIFTDNFARRVRYAPWPIHWLLEMRMGPSRSVLDGGIETYLESIARAQALHPELLLLPGVEVTPYYYWSGSPWSGRLTLNNLQRDILVVPPPPAGTGPEGAASTDRTTALLRTLPVIENPNVESYGWGSLTRLLPGLILLGWGVWRLRRSRGRGWISVVLGLAGCLLLLYQYPYTEPLWRPYGQHPSFEPEQALIDHVTAGGGLIFWSAPEVAGEMEVSFGPMRIELRNPSSIEGLATTAGYTGFGGIYADRIRIVEPGELWDRLLLSYLDGDRQRPPWIIGEADFRAPGRGGKQITDILTVLRSRQRTLRAAFEALGEGRSYALRRSESEALVLRKFSLATPSGSAAWPGEALDVEGDGPLVLTLEVDSLSGDPLPIRARVVSQGRVRLEWEGRTPLRRRVREPLETPGPAGGGSAYYRVDVRGPVPHWILSNPIFVHRR